MLIPALRCYHAIGGAVGLPRINLIAGRLLVIIIEYLDFTHAFVGGVPVAWITNRQPVVASGRQLDLKPRDKISKLLFGVNCAALSWPASDSPLLHLIIIQRAGPAFEILAIEDRFETRRAAVAQQFIPFLRTGPPAETIGPPELPSRGWELKRAFGGTARFPLEIVFHTAALT